MSYDYDDDWRKCADWLERCGMLTDEQNFSLKCVDHLASILKDGVILCNLCNKLKPGSISTKNFSNRPRESPFLCGKNIRSFLNACKSSFNVKESNLFQPVDLTEFKDFGKVLRTLSKLSKTNGARKQDIEPFSIDEATDYVIMQRVIEEVEDEYNSSVYGLKTDIGTDDCSEEIYEVFVNKEDQRHVSQSKSKKETCIEELVVTEMNFVVVLRTIYKVFMSKLRNHLTSDEYASIFFMIDKLKEIHTKFHEKLSQAETSHQPAIEVAKCFLEVQMSLVIYGEFCSKVESSVHELIQVCQRNPTVREIVEAGSISARVKLHDLLIIPVQRILKYHLIIKELIKHCKGNEEEIINLKKALEVMEDLGMYINEVKRDNENIITIRGIEDSIMDLNKYSDGRAISLENYGRRHFDGAFDIKRHTQRHYQNRYIFLFDKLLIMCDINKKWEEYKYFASLAVRTLEIKACSGEKGLNHLILWNMEDPNDKLFVTSKKSDNLTKLFTYIELAKSNCCPLDGKSHLRFILINVKEASQCPVCQKLLKGKLSQGYQCQKTKNIVHKECLVKIADQAMRIVAPRPTAPPPRPRAPLPAPAASGRDNQRPKAIEPKSDNFQNQPWFSQVKSRSLATNLLDDYAPGTYLVRWSNEKKGYVVSLKFEVVRHMLIKKTDSGKFYFKMNETFDSIPLLIDHYKRNSLQDVFHIASTLETPYSESQRRDGPMKCRALYDFSATEAGQLTFCAGDVVEIISCKDGGWWKGMLNGTKGNLPSNYVEIIEQ